MDFRAGYFHIEIVNRLVDEINNFSTSVKANELMFWQLVLLNIKIIESTDSDCLWIG
ncbi:MAG: hypothetical protein V2I33_07400 [Kangiellaceae bacterium]|nr:hypothetical protein [Kangiellaceae bacterium]